MRTHFVPTLPRTKYIKLIFNEYLAVDLGTMSDSFRYLHLLWHLWQFETIVTTNGMHGLGHYIHSDYLGSFLYLYISTLQIYA